MRLSDDQSAARSVGRNSERFRHRTSQATAFGGTALRSVLRAANKAAENVYQTIRKDGHQKNVLDAMQTRDELYDRIGYHAFESKLDVLFAAKK